MKIKTTLILLFAASLLIWSCKSNLKETSTTISKEAATEQKTKKVEYKDQWIFEPKDPAMKVTLEQQQEIATTEEDMQWYKDAKFGVFVHWGPALSVTKILSWGRNGERPGAGKGAKSGIPTEIYDVQYKNFNPVNFDADRWMQNVKDFGASYLVFTAKHHDGFCFFDAPGTDYDIMNTPFKRDIAKELADAAHKHGIKLFWYYSQPDWSHPDNLREKHYENYVPYMNKHVEKLFTEYGDIAGVFWDGLSTKYWQWDTYNLIKKMKKWQPGLLSNPRGGRGWEDDTQRGSFDSPEQSLGPVNHHRYWEANLTMADVWLYSPDGPIKTSEGVLGMLIQVAGNGGNLLLNFGPNGKGEFVAEEAAQARKVGDWLKVYGHTIYNTRRGIYIGGDWGASTQTENKLYLHFLKQLSNNTTATFVLPKLPMGVLSVKGITKGFKDYKIQGNKLIINFDKNEYVKNLDNIVELTLDKTAEGLERINTWHAEPLTTDDFTISASSFTSKKNSPEVIYSKVKNVFSEGIRLKSWWTPGKKDENPELTLDFKSAKKIKTILLSEHMRTHSVRDFDIETKDINGNWTKIFDGGVIGEGLRVKLNGEEIYGVKLKVIESPYGIQVTAFNVYE